MPRRRRLFGIAAAIAAVATVVGISIAWPGLDAQRTPPVDTSVWALQTADGYRYARVNTAIGELDTVRSVSNPTSITQSGGAAYLFSESFGRVTPIDEAMPIDLDNETLRASATTPPGTVEVAAEGDYVAYRTDSGAVFAGRLSGGDAAQLDPYATGTDDETTPEYTAEAIAVDGAGVLYSYSSVDGAVLRYRIDTGHVIERDEVPQAPTALSFSMTAVSGRWLLVSAADRTAWRQGEGVPVALETTGAVALARPSTTGDAWYLADEVGMLRLPLDEGAAERVAGGAAEYGQPARPVVDEGVAYGAWLGRDEGRIWTEGDGESALDYAGRELAEVRRPVLAVTPSAMILNETRSGWVWTMPDGELVPSSQRWSVEDETDVPDQPSEEEAEVVIDPRPPVAEPDVFGVRAGSLASLPVLLNDHDPNHDVLSIDPLSIAGLDPAFGTVAITDHGGRLAVQVAPTATGTATFTYRVTDGTAPDGLYSEPTTVTLRVVGDTVNTAPEWCGSEGCLVTWPRPEVAPGGTVTVPVLSGWVDPEGDPVLLLAVENASGIGAVASTPAGDVVFQHPDPSSAEAALVELIVHVSDTRGAVSTRSLMVQVAAEPQVTAESFTVIDSRGAGVTIDVAPHVTGTAGAVGLSAARVLDDAPAEVVVDAGGTSFDFSAQEPGSYRVRYTVTEGEVEATATVRVTILPDDASAQLATGPVIAFVRPKEDATVDVFAAVENPTRRVLLLSEIESDAEPGAGLQVDAVGQRYIRVAGTTASGEPGPLGTVRYTVSDGTDDAGSRVRGEAVVYLLPPAPELAPIASDDRVVVRAGAQVDIPVLANDVAPAGSAMTLNPASVISSTDDALAFASGDVLRYLAPSEPGDYTVEYSIFATGAPLLADTATVRVSVISDESNRAPRPATLEGRVLSGQSTTIPLRQFGVDPDGDAVVLDRIVTQPEAGSATLSADGDAIVYTSAPGDRGQRSFRYSVVDGAGATGTGTVRVGVLDDESNPSPITFTDYVQVQVGAGNAVRVSPLANDIDPTGGGLRLTGVRPDLPPTSADGEPSEQYAQLVSQLGELSDTTIVIAAGTAPGTLSYLYDVESASGNTGRGLIVVKVVRESVPDYPVVSDTLLTAETRERLPRGIDVLTGKVRWTGGDVDALELDVWGDADGITAEGRQLRGSVTPTARIVPFAVTGEAADGTLVETYAFLRIPAEGDVTLAMRSGLAPLQVGEGEVVSFDMDDLVAVPSGRVLEIGADPTASGARAEGRCVAESGTSVRYEAGFGAPWTDACTVPVRVDGQEEWSYLSVPVRVRAVEPQPELRPASIVAGPGETVTFDLTGMTTWQSRADWAGIAYSAGYDGALFDVRLDGSLVTATAADAALPGAEDSVVIGVTSHAGVAPVRLLLRVGPAPSTLPQGGTTAAQCSQAAGDSCDISVIGAAGEINPLPRTPLEVVDIATTGACTGVTFEVVSASTVRANWGVDAPGATCQAAFSVRDAQGRTTSSERNGHLLLDLQGYPQAPASIVQTRYDDGIVQLRVDPGPARLAYPALTGFVVRFDGQTVATCTPDGVCPEIAAPNGEERLYEAASVNAVGESHTRVATSAWAYDPPPAPSSVTATPAVTGGDGGVVAVRITGIDTVETGYIELKSATGDTVQVPVGPGDETLDVPRYRIGANTPTALTVTPFSRFAIPPGLTGSESGAAVTIMANGIGAPTGLTLTASSVSTGGGTSSITASGTAASGGTGSETRLGIAIAGGTCVATVGGGSATTGGLPDGEVYTVQLCAEAWQDGTLYGRAVVSQEVRAVQSTTPPQGYTFRVDATPDIAGDEARWVIRETPTSAETPPRHNTVEFQGGPLTSIFDRDPGMSVRYVHAQWGPTTGWAPVVPATGSAPYQVQARWGIARCDGGQPLELTGTSSGGQAAIAFRTGAARYYDAAGALLETDTPAVVPDDAVRVEGLGVTVGWGGLGWGLADAVAEFGGTCTPAPPTEGAP